MNNEENSVVHTFNSDIQEELNKKDASLIGIATASTNHIEPVEPPNYKALFMVLFGFVSMGAMAYIVYLYTGTYNAPASSTTIQQNTNTIATSTQKVDTETFQTLMPNSYVTLNPYMNLYVYNNKYITYKISNYDGLINIMIANESNIKTDMENYFGKSENFGAFQDFSYNNWDMRLASSTATNTMVYAIANREYVIFATNIKNWEDAYSAIIK